MKKFRVAMTLAAALLFLSALPVARSAAVHAAESMAHAIFLSPEDLSWHNAPAALPPGAQMSVLMGDPSLPGPFVVRFKAPADYRIPPHYHSRAESLTVISGTLYLGGGEAFDPTKAHVMNVGAFHYLPARVSHFAFAKVPTVVEIHGEGPFDIVYLNPKDDPLKGGGK